MQALIVARLALLVMMFTLDLEDGCTSLAASNIVAGNKLFLNWLRATRRLAEFRHVPAHLFRFSSQVR